jgi:uncharacterized membrane protein YhfC
MDILLITHPLNGLLMVGMPIGLGIYLVHKLRLEGGLWWAGALTFISAQALHLPLNLLWLNPFLAQRVQAVLPAPWGLALSALALGLSAGVFEELARYSVYRWWRKDARTWGRGLLLGAGHGGIEAILLGALVLLTYIQLIAIRGTDLEAIVPPEQLDLARLQIAQYWGVTWYDSLLGAVERLFAIILQISFSILVLQAFTRRQARWLWLAISAHTLVDTLAIFIVGQLGIYWAEAAVGVLALGGLGLIRVTYQPAPIEEHPAPLPPPAPGFPINELPETMEQLDKSRYA